MGNSRAFNVHPEALVAATSLSWICKREGDRGNRWDGSLTAKSTHVRLSQVPNHGAQTSLNELPDRQRRNLHLQLGERTGIQRRRRDQSNNEKLSPI